ncbi:DUF3265 domain-containing protein [Vibrio alginolyticus]|nr:DUF3265 domain-containing protein [Vibrio alginolyticus]EMA2429536.1 DUF3265 domain-containing protein [Vibrio alginolyticus]
MTRRSSGIHAAWHFWYAASFGGESCLRKVCLCGIHPLTLRYVLLRKIRNLWMKILKFGVSTTKRHCLVHIQNVLSSQLDSMNQTSK